jgi:hypothetical protein
MPGEANMTGSLLRGYGAFAFVLAIVSIARLSRVLTGAGEWLAVLAITAIVALFTRSVVTRFRHRAVPILALAFGSFGTAANVIYLQSVSITSAARITFAAVIVFTPLSLAAWGLFSILRDGPPTGRSRPGSR